MVHNKAVRRLSLWVCFVTALQAQSGAVFNAADEALLPGYMGILSSSQSLPATLAPGSLATILNYSSASIGDATVSLRSAGQASTISATIVANSQDRITFVVPPGIPAGSVQVIYHFSGDITRWAPATIVPARFALFRTFASGPPAAQSIAADGKQNSVGMATPVSPGNVLVLWGSGLGGTPASQLSVTLGGVPQKILFAGPSAPGLDQINLLVASGTPVGCYVPLVVNYGLNSFSSTVSVSADGAPCSHPLGLSLDDLTALDAGNNIVLGQFDITSDLLVASPEHASRQESLRLSMLPHFYADIQGASLAGQAGVGCIYADAAFRNSSSTNGDFTAFIRPFQLFGPAIQANSGENTVTLQRQGDVEFPAFYASSLPPSADGSLAALPTPLLQGGLWTLASPTNPKASLQLPLPRPIQLSGPAPAVFNRTTGQTVTWRGDDYDAASQATLSLSGIDSPFLAPASLTCYAPGNSGAIAIPASLLAKMPAGAATLTLRLTPARPPSVSLPATSDPGGLFPLTFISNISTSDTRPADIQ